MTAMIYMKDGRIVIHEFCELDLLIADRFGCEDITMSDGPDVELAIPNKQDVAKIEIIL